VPVSAGVLRDHLAYTAWASQRLVKAVSQLPPEEIARDFGTSDGSILRTLVHVFAADRIWLARLNGQSPAALVSDADYQRSVLENDWPALYARWFEWARALTDESAQDAIAYSDMRGNPYRQPVWQIVLHVVNHGTHHRGQVSGFLRTLKHAPPPLDLIAYYREQAAAAA